MHKTVFTLAAIAVLVPLATLGHADPRGGPRDPEQMFERMVQGLDLTPAQQAAIGDIMRGNQAGMAQDRQRLDSLREQLDTEPFDAGRAQAAADEIGQITARRVYAHAEVRARIEAELSDEQRAELTRLREQRREHRKAWRGMPD
jgi:Spy/CpxP family protein refolding chaperone